jgi:RHS repeat-associated protein
LPFAAPAQSPEHNHARYDAENHLVNTANVIYTYDGDGKRVQKSNGKLYWYGTSSDPLAETDASGNTTADYVYFGGKRIAMLPTNAVSNGSFEVGVQGWSYWGTGITAQLISTPSLCYSGNDCLQLSNSDSGLTGDTDNQLIPVAIGQTISLSAWVYQQSGGSGAAYWQLAVFDANSSTVGIAYVEGSPSSSTGTWVNETASYTVPTWATCPCYAYIYASLNTGSQSDVARFDAATVNVSGSGASDALYYLTDHLGTSRVITNSAGSLCYDADFYPFGSERAITNSCPQNYKFTGKERDSESGLDNLGARYNASQMGRFMSPDPSGLLAQKTIYPQSWNLYAYAMNNPLTFIDPTGLDCVYANDAGNGVESIDHNSNSGECGQNGGSWAPGYVDENWATFNNKTDMFQVGSVNGTGSSATVDYTTFAAGAQTQFNGDESSCLSGCTGFSLANADWLQSQLVGNSKFGGLDGYIQFLTGRIDPLRGGLAVRLAAGPLDPSADHWAGPAGMGPPGGRGDWAASVHDYNFSTNGITMGSYLNPGLSLTTSKALIQSNNTLIRNAGGIQSIKMALFFGVTNAVQWYSDSWK